MLRNKVLFLCLNISILFFAFVSCEFENPIARLIKKSLEKTARACMSHVNATQRDLEQLRKDPPYPEKGACIVKCLLEKIGIVKNSRYSKNGFMAVVTPLVLRNAKKMEHMQTVSGKCDKEVNHQSASPCHLGNEIPLCIYKYAPELKFRDV